jgi:hypothetical protein
VVNYAIQRVSIDFPAVEKLDTLVLRDTTEGAALPSDLSELKWAQIIIGDTLRRPLEFVPVDSLYARRNVNEPRFYYTQADRLFTWKAFNAQMFDQDTLMVLIAYYAIDPGLAADSLTTNIAEDYRDALIDFICYRLELMRYRFEAAAIYAARYDKAKAEARPGK